MNEEKIKRLIKILEESDIGEIELSSWGRKIRVSKGSLNNNGVAINDAVNVVQVNKETASPSTDTAAASTETPVNENHVEIKSPMVGTYYSASSPDVDPYVKVGDTIKEGDVLCIVEAMKLMNEIESDYSGVILEVLVDNSKPVQYNEPLFLIDIG